MNSLVSLAWIFAALMLGTGDVPTPSQARPELFDQHPRAVRWLWSTRTRPLPKYVSICRWKYRDKTKQPSLVRAGSFPTWTLTRMPRWVAKTV
jgi:hypothetical protein